MFIDMLFLFIVLSILFFIISVYTAEKEPKVCIPFIMLGMIFTILCAYGCWNVEMVYVNYNATTGFTNTSIYSTEVYGDPYSYVFVLFFFIYFALFIRGGFNMWREALQTQGEMDYKRGNRRKNSRR